MLCSITLPKICRFPDDKESGEPCRHLRKDFLCKVHDQLRERGFHGCVSYECFGAGQKVSQLIYAGNDWRTHPSTSEEMFRVFPVVQQLQEMMVYVNQCMQLEETAPFLKQLGELYDTISTQTHQSPAEIMNTDIAHYRTEVSGWLNRSSDAYRTQKKKRNALLHKKGTDCIEANFSNQDLSHENFRGRLMIAANFTNSDLRRCDFLGADVRGAKFQGANLSGALFLTQAQLNSAKGDANTIIPEHLQVPDHWLTHKERR